MENKYQLRIRYQERRYYFGAVETKSEQRRWFMEMVAFLNKEKRSGLIVSSTGVILKPRFRYKGSNFKVIHTESTGKGIFDAIDTVQNVTTKELKEYTREQLSSLLKNKKDEQKSEI